MSRPRDPIHQGKDETVVPVNKFHRGCDSKNRVIEFGVTGGIRNQQLTHKAVGAKLWWEIVLYEGIKS